MTDRRSKESDSFDDKLIAFVRKAQEDAAAIQRVRDVLRGLDPFPGAEAEDVVDQVKRALDGDT